MKDIDLSKSTLNELIEVFDELDKFVFFVSDELEKSKKEDFDE